MMRFNLRFAPSREVCEDDVRVFVHRRRGCSGIGLRAREFRGERAVSRGGDGRGGGGAERLAQR